MAPPMPFSNGAQGITTASKFVAAAVTANILLSLLSARPFNNRQIELPRSTPAQVVGAGQAIPLPIFVGIQGNPVFPTDGRLPTRVTPIDQTWTQNLLESTLGSVPVPFKNYDWQLPRTSVKAIGDGQSIPLSIFAGIQGQPFVSVDSSLPARAARIDQTWTQNLLASTLNVRPFQNYDWQLPRSAPQPVISWSQNLLESTLSFAPVPFRNFDWQIPRVAQAAVSWTQSTPLVMLAQPAGRNEYGQIVVPVRADYGWTQNLLESTLGVVQAPLLNYDWPLPRTPFKAIGDGQAIPLPIFVGIQGNPFFPVDTSLPVRSLRIDQTWTQNLLQTTLGFTPSPFTQSDFRLPITVSQIDRTWTQNLIETTLSQPIGAPTPPSRIDPVRTTYGSAQGIPTVLLQQASTPFNNNQVSLPAIPDASYAQRAWSTNLLETTLKSRQVVWVPSGGIHISGHALVIRKAHWLPAGGIHISGAANIIEVPAGGTGKNFSMTAPGFKTNIGLNKTKNLS